MKRAGLLGVFVATVLVALAYASAFLPGGAPSWAPWLLGLGTALVLVSVMVVGAERAGSIGPLALPFLAIFGILAGGFALLLTMPAVEPTDPVLFVGLPPRAAVVLYLIGLTPALIVPAAYALTFDRLTLSAESLERVRAHAARAAAALEPEPMVEGDDWGASDAPDGDAGRGGDR